jgi:hypothetical protein
MNDRGRVPDFAVALARCSDRAETNGDVDQIIREAEMWLAGVHSDTNEPDLVFSNASWPAIWKAIPRSAAVWAAFAAMQVAARRDRAAESTAPIALPPPPAKARSPQRSSPWPIEL